MFRIVAIYVSGYQCSKNANRSQEPDVKANRLWKEINPITPRDILPAQKRRKDRVLFFYCVWLVFQMFLWFRVTCFEGKA